MWAGGRVVQSSLGGARRYAVLAQVRAEGMTQGVEVDRLPLRPVGQLTAFASL